LLILRYFFGFKGNTLINNAVANTAKRTTASSIEAFIEASFINTPSTERCTSYGWATYSFYGGITGKGTVVIQSTSACTPAPGKDRGYQSDNNLSYSLSNIRKSGADVWAKMTVNAFGTTRTKNVKINNGIVDY